MKKIETKQKKIYVSIEEIRGHFSEKILMFMLGIGLGYFMAILEINIK